MTQRATFIVCLAFSSIAHGAVHAAELGVFASRAVWTVLTAIGPEFETNFGHKLNTTTGLSAEFVRRINSGKAFDVIAAPPGSLVGLISSGKILPDSRIGIARSKYGVVVRAGATKPDIGSVESFKRTLLNARSITYLPVPGVPQLIERLGLKDAIASKLTIPDDDISAELVARGEIELGIVAATQAVTTHGVELAGLLPAEIEISTEFAGAISAASANPDAARSLLVFLTGQRQRKRSELKAWSRSDGLPFAFCDLSRDGAEVHWQNRRGGLCAPSVQPPHTLVRRNAHASSQAWAKIERGSVAKMVVRWRAILPTLPTAAAEDHGMTT